jgi:hypothetical protein
MQALVFQSDMVFSHIAPGYEPGTIAYRFHNATK